MSLFAGIYSLQEDGGILPPPPDSVTAMTQMISRADDPVTTFASDRFFLAKVDINAFAAPGYHHAPGVHVAALAGHLLSRNEPGGTRHKELARLSRDLRRGRRKALRKCQGSFALCYYDLTAHRLVLATDKLGIRPLYYCRTPAHLYFANSLRVLEFVGNVPKRLDMQGLAEMLAFKYPLGPRTPYADIGILESAGILSCDGRAVYIGQYFRWDSLQPLSMREEEILDTAYDLFRDAVAKRYEVGKTALSLLSGGLDSRCIVMMLNQLGADFRTLTFEHGCVDEELAKRFAKKAGIDQVLVAGLGQGEMEWASRIKDVKWADEMPTEPLVFSGDGGSVGVGCEYVKAEDIRIVRQEGIDPLVHRLWEMRRPPKRFFKNAVYQHLIDALFEGIYEEFSQLACSDAGRTVHMFYMNNDQRRHLHPLFENVDLYRVEFLTPFFDAAFMELILSAPIDLFLKHGFYHKWVTRFPKVFMAVPWQTYRGHLPCPVKGNVAGPTQWERTRWARFTRSLSSLRRGVAEALTSRFPSSIMRRGPVLLAAVLHGTFLRYYGHVFANQRIVSTYERACNGVHVYPGGVRA